MPIYEYECADCGHRSEAIQRLSEEHLKECEECGGRLRRLLSAPAVQFKGSGWYVTDYGGRKVSGSSESSSDSGSGSDSKESAAPANGKTKSDKKATDKGSKAPEKSSGKSSGKSSSE